jgi:hypothetical protein
MDSSLQNILSNFIENLKIEKDHLQASQKVLLEELNISKNLV